ETLLPAEQGNYLGFHFLDELSGALRFQVHGDFASEHKTLPGFQIKGVKFRRCAGSRRPEGSLDHSYSLTYFTGLVKRIRRRYYVLYLPSEFRRPCGRLFCDSTAIERIGPGTARSRRRGSGHGILHLAAPHAEKSAAVCRSHRSLRQDERFFEITPRPAFGDGPGTTKRG